MNGSTRTSVNKSKDTLKQIKRKTKNPKSMGHWESNIKREIHSITGLSQKNKKKLK